MTPAPAPPASCPSCGLDGEGIQRDQAGVNRANYLCPAGHIWQTHWTTLEVPA